MHGLDQSGAADAAVKALSDHHVVLFVVLELHIGHDGLADADLEHLHRLLGAGGAYVDDVVGDGGSRSLAALRGGFKVDRLGGDQPRQIASLGVAHQNLGGGQTVHIPSAQGHKTQGAVGADGVDHKSNLVAVGVQHEYRKPLGRFVGPDVDVAQAVVGHLGHVAAVLFGNVENGVLKSRGAEGVGEIGDQFQALGIDVCVHMIILLFVR